MIGIVNYGMGNIRSVANAVYEQGFDPLLINHADDFSKATHVILPGVGHFKKAMANLEQLSLLTPLKQAVLTDKKPLLGICLGMQLLLTHSEEGDCAGLDLIAGDVRLFRDPKFRVPHVGWNNLNGVDEHPVLRGIPAMADFYFVHSYYASTASQHTLAQCEYDRNFSAIVGVNNIIGMQFHPEKSQKNGLLLIENFCNWDGVC